MCQTHRASDPWLDPHPPSTHPLSTHTPSTHYTDINGRQRADLPSASPDPASVQHLAPQTSRIVITTKNADPYSSFVKEVDVGNTMISYVPFSFVFSETFNSVDPKNVVNVMCYQTDVNFSMALLCKPQQLPENYLKIKVWTVDDRIRQHAMWSSPELVNVRMEEPETKVPFFLGKSGARSKVRLHYPTPRGPVQVLPAGKSAKKGKVPSIVALFTSHAKSHHKLSHKTSKQSEAQEQVSKQTQRHQAATDKESWHQKKLPSTQEIQKVLAKGKQWHFHPMLEKRQVQEETTVMNPAFVKSENLSRGKKFGFSYHLDPPTAPCHTPRTAQITFPPPPQLPLPPVPELADPIPGPSSRPEPYKHYDPVGTLPELDVATGRPKSPRPGEALVEGRRDSYPGEERTRQLLTPLSERQRRESTTLFIPEDAVKPHQVNSQKLSAVLVLSMFVVALLIFYLVYFI